MPDEQIWHDGHHVFLENENASQIICSIDWIIWDWSIKNQKRSCITLHLVQGQTPGYTSSNFSAESSLSSADPLVAGLPHPGGEVKIRRALPPCSDLSGPKMQVYYFGLSSKTCSSRAPCESWCNLSGVKLLFRILHFILRVQTRIILICPPWWCWIMAVEIC